MPESSSAPRRDLIVVGAFAGGVEALSALVAGLPPTLAASVLIVLHLAPDSTSVLPRILARAGRLPTQHAGENSPLEPGRVYVASPDRHLVVSPGFVHAWAGPKENRHRPAVDPLFRTAARAYGDRVIGVVLTGSGDDGTAGLAEIRQHGGTTVVQAPLDALCSEMPRSALEYVDVEYCVPIREIAALLVRLTQGDSPPSAPCVGEEVTPVSHRAPPREARPEQAPPGLDDVMVPGPHAGFTCPQCNGHLWEEEKNGGILQFRCRVGHVFSPNSLLTEKGQALESTLWAALNAFQESAALARRMADRSGERGHHLSARRLNERAADAEQHARVLRDLLTSGAMPVPTNEDQLEEGEDEAA